MTKLREEIIVIIHFKNGYILSTFQNNEHQINNFESCVVWLQNVISYFE